MHAWTRRMHALALYTCAAPAMVCVMRLAIILLFLTLSAAPMCRGADFAAANQCALESLTKSPETAIKVWNADHTHYLINKKDKKGDWQIFVGGVDAAEPVCISCKNATGSPAHDRNKMQVNWDPSGRWIIYAGEKLFYNEIWIPKKIRQGFLECGVWMDIYATSYDGTKNSKLHETKSGFTGIAFAPDGKRGVWAESIGSAPKSVFGKWILKMADFVDVDGKPALVNIRDITPAGATWLEPGNFSPNGHDLALNADIGMDDAQGQDQYILNVDTGEIRNLTRSPHVWDEHGVFSPDGRKLFFMSSYPYRDKKNSYKVFGLKVDFMLINADGTGLQQVSHFNTPGSAEYYKGGATPAVGMWAPDGKSIDAAVLLSGARFPDYDIWKIVFKGNCGNCGE